MAEWGRGGMGTHKHGVSGTPGKNRRTLRQFGYALAREQAARLRGVPMLWYASIRELMGGRRTR